MRINFAPTVYPDLNDVLWKLNTSLQSILDKDFAGAYLQGSFAVGDYDSDSDVDFIIVTQKELSVDQVKHLQKMHAQIYDLESPWSKHLDGSYFPEEVLRKPPQPGRLLCYLDNGSRELVESSHCNTLVVRWVLREHGVILTGPAPKTLVEPVPPGDLRREIRTVITEWGTEIIQTPGRFSNRFYQSFIVLSYCRMLNDLKSGSISSKRAAAEWAKQNLDHAWRSLIDSTWEARSNPEITIRQPADPKDFLRTLEFVQYVIELSEKDSLT
jgi:predicted nucleotidyltransferase